ncbi:T9SS type A sorting domain-containing protein [Flavobacterium sp. AS60]|uniref:T9SS type A sorting domain-containing protein n=1 Tax=Flavobacterium anseongense TaxID=2910677 RepID=UPI001F18EF36|nr:T9SS type A sorting domain-containing protein [Flavobacterium sp. AS60]MCF6130116.1 T9SS type A sorting domain-containing protein [Flavobacterium sp. AS60]
MKKVLVIVIGMIMSFNLNYCQQLDATFGNSGKLVNDLSLAVDALISMKLQPDGKIIAAGSANDMLSLVRYEPDGTLDNAFGTDGKVITPIRCGFSWTGLGIELALQTDGKIVVLSKHFVSNTDQMIVTRYNSNGTLDTSFGTNGITNISSIVLDNSLFIDSIRILASNKIMVTASNQQNKIYVLRFNSNGSLDTTFATNGLVTLPVPDGFSSFTARGFYIYPDSSMLVGAFMYTASNSNANYVLTRFLSDGTLDTNFGTNGFSITNINSGSSEPRTINVQADEKIVFSGSCYLNFVMIRYNTDGTLDTTFNTTGIVKTNFGATSICSDALIESDGKIILVGNIGDDFGCVRYNSNGTIDSAFGTNGAFRVDFGASYDYGRKIIEQPDGKYLTGGLTSYMCSDRAFALARFSLPNLDVADSERATVTLYPNPTYDLLNINSKNPIQSVALYAINGQLVAYQLVNDLTACIDVAHLSPGIYLTKIQTDAGVSTYKISKE